MSENNKLKIFRSSGGDWLDETDCFVYESPMQYCLECYSFNFAEDCETVEDEDLDEEDWEVCCGQCHSSQDSMTYIESQDDMNSLMDELIKSVNYKLMMVSEDQNGSC